MAQLRSRRGRPPGDATGATREQIVAAACRHFAQDGLRGSSNRRIAEDADVTAAMVHYYFRTREALFQAVLEAAFEPLVERMAAIDSLEQWVHTFHAHLSARPWLPHLMMREVLPHDGGLRPLFMRDFAPRIFSFVRACVASAAQRRGLGADFDVDRHVVLLMGMLVYPFLGLEIAQDLTGRSFDQTMLDGFRDDALRLFIAGLDARGTQVTGG